MGVISEILKKLPKFVKCGMFFRNIRSLGKYVVLHIKKNIVKFSVFFVEKMGEFRGILKYQTEISDFFVKKTGEF